MKTTTAKAAAWIAHPESATEFDINDVCRFVYSGEDANMEQYGWLKVGTAEITLTSTLSKNDLVLSMVNTQEAKIKKIQADAENQINIIKRKIMELKTITFEG